MAGNQISKTKDEMLNDSSFQNVVRKTNNIVSNMTTDIIQKNLSNTSGSSTFNQEMNFSDLEAEGDIVIDSATQDQDTTINMSALADVNMKNDITKKIQNEIQDKLVSAMTNTQGQNQERGEQAIAALSHDVTDAVKSLGASVTGTDVKNIKERSIANIIDMKTEEDVKTTVQNAINTNLMSDTMTNLSSALVGNQAVNINNLKSKHGSIVVSNIGQKMLSEQMLKAVQKSGVGNSLVSEITNISKSDLAATLAADQESKQVDKSTGDSIASALGPIAEIFSSPFMAVLVFVGVIVFIIVIIIIAKKMGGSKAAPPSV